MPTKLEVVKERQRNGTLLGSERARVAVGPSTTRVLAGAEDLSDWDDEELEQGRRRAKDGTFKGRPPTVVPKVIHDELIRRTLSKAHDKLRQTTVKAVEMLAGILDDPEAENKDRISAAKIILDRVMGKEPIKVEVGIQAKWEGAMEVMISKLENMVDAESFEDGDEEDPFAD